MGITHLTFTKMHGLGNDFIVLDGRSGALGDLPALARTLCRRRFGVGADQVLVLEDSEVADYRMLIYNADGSEVEMCGNGIRAFARYIWDRGMSSSDVLEVETLAGIIRPARAGEMVRVDMGKPELEGRKIPVALDGPVVNYPLMAGDRSFALTCVSMGNPHAVAYVDELDEFPVGHYGPMIETSAIFPKRTNVEFIEVLGRGEIRMRVWERGTGETLACGTGACGAAVASMVKGLVDRTVTVHLPGGDLVIEWDEADGRVYMTGPAVEVYQGTLTGLVCGA